MSNLLIKNIKSLVQVRENLTSPLAGSAMAELPCIDHAYLEIQNGKILGYGPMDQCPRPNGGMIDAKGRFVFPGFCDSHTHIVYAASREKEFVQRIKGASYEEIAQAGGGILNSAEKLQNTTEEDLYNNAVKRLEEVMQMGTTAIEIKSGYGLSVDSELKMLRVIKELSENFDIPIAASFLGAHAVPTEYKHDRAKYIDLITKDMIPKIAEEKLAQYCDVFCDFGFFTVEETSTILEAALSYNLIPKLHANELGHSGGIQTGVKYNAISVDHLEYVSDEDLKALQESKTIATLLPSTSFFLNIPYAPARRFINAEIPVALASDYNPGSSPSGNMHLIISLACTQLKMTPEEAINAATINSSYALGMGDKVGSITKGKLANVFITKPMDSLAFFPYSFGSDLIDKVIIKGELAF